MSIANVIQSLETKLAINRLTASFDGVITGLRGLGLKDPAKVESFIKTELVPTYVERLDDIKSGGVNFDAPIEDVAKKTRAKRTPKETASTDPGDTGTQAPKASNAPKIGTGKTGNVAKAGADMM